MPEQLVELNLNGFHLINGIWHFPFLDHVMPWLRNKYFWAPLYIFIISFFVLNYRMNGLISLLYLGITVLFCDQISSFIIKPYFAILRPCNDPMLVEDVRLLVNCGSGFSFTSSHAANHFGTATFLGLILLDKRWVMPLALLWAAIISYAQIYVGVHYPLDVIGGGALGMAFGTLLSILCKRHLTNNLSS